MLTYFMVFVAGAWVGSICMGIYAAFLALKKSRGKGGFEAGAPE
jgi:hypothetical protein